MDGKIQLADLINQNLLLLKTIPTKKISLTKILMKKFGVSLMLIRTLFLGNTEETKKLIQQTDGLTQLVDLLLLKIQTTKKIFQTKILMKKFGVS